MLSHSVSGSLVEPHEFRDMLPSEDVPIFHDSPNPQSISTGLQPIKWDAGKIDPTKDHMIISRANNICCFWFSLREVIHYRWQAGKSLKIRSDFFDHRNRFPEIAKKNTNIRLLNKVVSAVTKTVRDAIFDALEYVGAFASNNSVYRTFQLPSLVRENQDLYGGSHSEHGSGDEEVPGEPSYRLICGRFVLALAGGAVAFFLALLGWENLDKKRRILGTAYLCGAMLLSGTGFGLLLLTVFPGTWGWFI